ncbi:MAG: ribbon-helix-helix protein, CopG family [Nitrospirae bacterium]|nr:ribbon-helix-helix protein, CopG family [Nitrospirota bacterium]
MKRTQIYIDEKTYSHLEKESRIKGVSVSEIIRESVKNKLSKRVERILKSAEKVCGLWKDRELDVDAYIRNVRKDRKLW